MTSSKNQPPYQGIDRRAPRTDALAGPRSLDAFPNRNRSQKIGGRHGAITTTLYNWNSYKNWADKMRGNFDEKK
jgi:hypothetical protein